MNFNTNKEIGNAGLSLAIAYFGSNGYTVSIPLNDTQDYDLIVEKENILYRIQIKATKHKKKTDNYIVTLKSAGGTKGIIYKRVIETNIDFLFVLCEDHTMYLIPKNELKRSSITLNKANENRNINQNTKDYSKYIVTFG